MRNFGRTLAVVAVLMGIRALAADLFYQHLTIPGRFILYLRLLDDGTTAGYTGDQLGVVPGVTSFVRQSNGQITTVTCPGAHSTFLNSVNSRGEGVGYFEVLVPGTANVEVTHAFHRSATGVCTDLGTNVFPDGYSDIDSHGRYLAGLLVPNASGGVNDQAALVDPSTGTSVLIEYPGATDTVGTGMNDVGSVVGTASFCTGSGPCSGRGFLWTSTAGFTDISVPGALSTVPQDVNDSGQIVGYIVISDPNTSSGVNHSAFIRDTTGAYSVYSPDRAFGTHFTGINNSGQIAGTDGQGGFIANSAPDFTNGLRIGQVAEGASWKTLMAITNLDQVPVAYEARFWADDGTPLRLPILNGTPGTLSGTLAPGVAVFAETPGTSPTLFQGWAEVASSGRIGVLTIFRLSVPGRPDSEGSVTGALSGNRIFLPFDNTQGYVTSVGVANTNPTQAITVSLLFQLENGTQVPGSLFLPAHTHTAFVLPAMFPSLAGGRGSILFSAPSADITVLGLRTNPTNSFTSIGTFQ